MEMDPTTWRCLAWDVCTNQEKYAVILGALSEWKIGKGRMSAVWANFPEKALEILENTVYPYNNDGDTYDYYCNADSVVWQLWVLSIIALWTGLDKNKAES